MGGMPGGTEWKILQQTTCLERKYVKIMISFLLQRGVGRKFI